VTPVRAKKVNGAQSIERAMKVLRIVAAATGGATLSHVVSVSGLNKATAHRLLTVLTREGLVQRHAESKVYYPGEQLYALGILAAPRFGLHQLAQRLDGLDHDIIELRERSRLLEEEIHFKLEEESNRHLHTLSIVTTLLLPPTLITGVFGMNTKGLPLTDVETGFLWAAALMVGSVALAYFFMRRMGIFR